MIQFEPRDISILTQVVFKEMFIEGKTPDAMFWEQVEDNTINLARTIYKVTNRIIKK